MGLYHCNVSLESALPEKHNSLRGNKGFFEKAVEGIKHMQEVDIKCSIWTYVKKKDVQEDLKDLKAIIDIRHRLKVWKVVI